MEKQKNFLSAVVYVRNNEDAVAPFLKNMIPFVEKNFENSEIILVNDFSSDATVEQIKACKDLATSTAISVVNLSYFHGIETAMNAGVDLSIGDFVLEIDSVFADYDLCQIEKAFLKTLEGFDIVSASPAKKLRFTSSIFYMAYKEFSGTHDSLRTESFRVLTRRAVNRINSMNKTVPFRKALYSNCGLKTFNFAYETIKTSSKAKDKNNTYRRKVATDALLLFTDAGYFFAKTITAIMCFISLGMLAYTVAVYLLAKPVAGWTTTLLFLSVAFLFLFSILLIIIRYLQILVQLAFRRTKYSFESIEKLTK